LADGWLSAGAGGSVLHVHVRPGAARSGVIGLHGGALAVRVAARPVEGAANRELLAVLAEALGIGRSALEVTSGARGRDKRVRVQGLEPAAVLARLRPLFRV
jgi:uncharacterized protein (TIGR00251 family)